LRKLLLPAAATALAAAIAVTPVLAQDGSSPTKITVTSKVTPNKAGTKKHPQGVKLRVQVHWATPEEFEKPVTQAADAYFPKGSLYNGAKYPSCAQATLARGGLAACPKKSIMGAGTATAFADTVLTHPQITVVNGGKSKVYLYTVLTNPARVKAPVPGVITKGSGKWAYKLHLEVPSSLQIVAGIPIQLRDFDVTAGGKKYAKDWLATTGCTGGKWPFSVTTYFDTGGSASVESSIACKK
jgi:hypothetical protein